LDQDLKYRGVPIYFDGKEWMVPSLSVRQFRDNVQLLSQPVGELTPENMAAKMEKFVPVIGMALRRNYPDITDDHLLDALDLSTFADAIRAVQAASGMKKGGSSPGEAAPVPASTGSSSTAP
jgi:hypothetical protein